jgi:hypothetical protein
MSPKIGNRYHCYCACGNCENFNHCFKGECDAPEPLPPNEIQRLFENAIKVPVTDEEKAILTGYRSPKLGSMKLPMDDLTPRQTFVADVPPKPGDVKIFKDGKWQWIEERYANLPKFDFAYIPIDQDGNKGPLVPARDPDESPKELLGTLVSERAQRIEDMIDWMEANGIPLEPWQANSLRAIFMADLPLRINRGKGRY